MSKQKITFDLWRQVTPDSYVKEFLDDFRKDFGPQETEESLFRFLWEFYEQTVAEQKSIVARKRDIEGILGLND
jgi:hypothetical protein